MILYKYRIVYGNELNRNIISCQLEHVSPATTRRWHCHSQERKHERCPHSHKEAFETINPITNGKTPFFDNAASIARENASITALSIVQVAERLNGFRKVLNRSYFQHFCCIFTRTSLRLVRNFNFKSIGCIVRTLQRKRSRKCTQQFLDTLAICIAFVKIMMLSLLQTSLLVREVQ